MSADNKTIVIFEDNANIRDLLKFFLVKRGFVPRMFEDGTEAVARVREHSPALIIMDMIMPGKDGLEACQDLRREGIQTPILMLTSKGFEADRARALAAGVNFYLLKPFNPDLLETAIKHLLRSE